MLAQAVGRPMGLFSTRVPNSGVQPGLILQLILGPNLAGTNSKKPKICSTSDRHHDENVADLYDLKQQKKSLILVVSIVHW